MATTGSVIFKLQGFDALSGKYYDLLESVPIQDISTTVLKIYPGLVANGNLVANDGLQMDFRVVATHSNAASMTYLVSINLIR